MHPNTTVRQDMLDARRYLKQVYEVRPHLVRNALVWLSLNNPFWADVEIDEAALQSFLGEDDWLRRAVLCGVPPEDLAVVEKPENYDNRVEHGVAAAAAAAHLDVDASGLFDADALRTLHEERLLAANNYLAAEQQRPGAAGTLANPLVVRADDEVVNEYSCERIYHTFPHLFPYGKGGPENWEKPKDLSAWVRHCLSLADDRFSRDKAFMFAMHDFWKRHMVLKHTRWVVDKSGQCAEAGSGCAWCQQGRGARACRCWC